MRINLIPSTLQGALNDRNGRLDRSLIASTFMLQGRHRTALVEWAEAKVATQAVMLLCLTRLMEGASTGAGTDAGEAEGGSEGETRGGQPASTLAATLASAPASPPPSSARRLIAEYSGMAVGRRLCMLVAFVDEVDHHMKWKDRGSTRSRARK